MSRVPFGHRVVADEIPAGGRDFHLEADEADRRGLADALGIPEVESLSAEIRITPIRDRAYAVRGAISAVVVQTDVVTLDPVRQKVTEPIEMTLVQAEEAAAGNPRSNEPMDPEEPDFFPAGRIDLGAIAREHLALGLDPYPRAAGVEFEGYAESDAEESPFAALVGLKVKGG